MLLQGPEHCHIDFCKQLAGCINNKDVFLCIVSFSVVFRTCLWKPASDLIGNTAPDAQPAGNWIAYQLEQHIPFFAGCLTQNWLSGLVAVMETHWVFWLRMIQMHRLWAS
jgi:hypothetical protein